MTCPATASRRSGISLLEVLISIGILSIGLLATLALIPAGRYYMKRAAVDDRAAAMVPSAFATLHSQGMLGVEASSWQQLNPQPSENSLNGETPVIRELTDWVIVSATSEKITQRYATRQRDPAGITAVSGSVPPASPGNVLTVSLTVRTGNSTQVVSPVVNQTTGAWSWTITPAPDAPDMQIFESGPNMGQVSNTPYTDYFFTATYTDGTGADIATTANPSSLRQYGYRRWFDERKGRARATYRLSDSAVRVNETADSATSLTGIFPTFAAAGVPAGNRIYRTISTSVTGASVAQWYTGEREGNYSQTLRFDDAAGSGETLISTIVPPKTPLTIDFGDTWVNGPNIERDVDWYRFDVARGDLVSISWSDPPNALEVPTFPAWLNTTDDTLPPLTALPAMSSANCSTYYIAADGFVVTRAQINPNPVPPSTPAYINRTAEYNVTFTRYRTGDRAVVLDPLMATRLDKTLPLRASRRLNFAALSQTHVPSGVVQPLALPRLNLEVFAAALATNNVDTALALSEFTFRSQDTLALDPPSNPADEDSAPRPVFDLAAGTAPSAARRQAEGKGSWLVMLEPAGDGPVSWNWSAGSTFNASVVVFENRPLPSITANSPIGGEYAFSAIWDDLDGMITVTIPASEQLVDEDIRPLFKSGYWLMLAPKVVSDRSSVTQSFDWVQIQSASLQANADGSTVVKVMPVKEPLDTILNPNLRQYANPGAPTQSQIWALVYEGAVAVVKKTVQLQP